LLPPVGAVTNAMAVPLDVDVTPEGVEGFTVTEIVARCWSDPVRTTRAKASASPW